MPIADELIGKLVAAAIAMILLALGVYFVRDYIVSGERAKQNEAVLETKADAETKLATVQDDVARSQADAVEKRRQQDAARLAKAEQAVRELAKKLEGYDKANCNVPAGAVDWMRGRRSLRSSATAGSTDAKP